MTSTFVIGDVQGCYDQLLELITKIDAIDAQSRLFFVGDLVNRGPKSLETLRLIKNLGTRANTVLGNHDLHLLAIAHGIRPTHRNDTLQAIIEAPDREELFTWLRHRPMALSLMHDTHLLVHAGIFSSWTYRQTLQLAQEIEAQLQSDHWLRLIKTMYGNTPKIWRNDLQGDERSRCIINGLTRMRFCHSDGAMDFDLKEGAENAPAHLTPWFALPQRQTADHTVIFGHWSTLGLLLKDNLIGVDTGCVWGGALTAIRLEDRRILQVKSPQHLSPL